jgi:hypothetical protein
VRQLAACKACCGMIEVSANVAELCCHSMWFASHVVTASRCGLLCAAQHGAVHGAPQWQIALHVHECLPPISSLGCRACCQAACTGCASGATRVTVSWVQGGLCIRMWKPVACRQTVQSYAVVHIPSACMNLYHQQLVRCNSSPAGLLGKQCSNQSKLCNSQLCVLCAAQHVCDTAQRGHSHCLQPGCLVHSSAPGFQSFDGITLILVLLLPLRVTTANYSCCY